MTLSAIKRIDPIQNVKVSAALASAQLESIHVLHEDSGYEFDVDLASRIVAHALKTHDDIDQLDQWLAPRLHCMIRLPRSVAADSGVWTWMASYPMKAYIERRWKTDLSAKLPWWRYNDRGVLRNGVARLWWAAELVRNGPDYSLVPDALRHVRVFQNVGELRYSWHRETARAFTRILKTYDDVGNVLSVVFNAYLATQCLETFDTRSDDLERTNWDGEWAALQPSFKELLLPVGELEGPNAGYSRIPVEERMIDWLKDLMDRTRA